MSEIEALIRSMSKDGKSPRAIATEFYERGVKNDAGKFLSPEMIGSYLRQTTQRPPPVVKTPLKAMEDAAYEGVEAGAENGGRPSGDYGHLGPAIYERPFRACALGTWPSHTDFRPDELEVRD